MYYSSIGILALIILLIVNNDILIKRGTKDEDPAHHTYRAFLIFVTVYFVTDILWGILYEHHLDFLVFADTSIYFLSMAFTILFWTRFVISYLEEDSPYGKAIVLAGRVIFWFQLAMIVLNFFVPILFSIDQNHTYCAEPARYVTLAAQIAMFALVSIYAFFVMFRSTGTKHVRYRSIGLSSFAMTGFVIAQSLFPLLPLYAIGCLLGSCVLHSFVLESEKEEYRTDLEKQLRDSIYKGSYFDLLTGLPSMTYFFELAEAEKSLIIQKGGSPTFLYIDLNGLKFYNSQYGFSEGDKLLKSFADVLVRHFGNDHSSRVGADHFGVITSADGLEDQLYQIFRENQDLNGGRSLPLRVGIYTDSEGKLPASIACDRAKLACTELNGIYASRFNYYKQELSEDAEKKRYIIEHVDQALAEGWIQVYYQPIVRATNRKACDEEALSRWISPTDGFLSPADFIPALESAGLIYKLDLYVVECALEKLKKQKSIGLITVPQSINLSRSDFENCDIVEEIRKRVDEAGIERSQISVEITESIIGSNFNYIKEQVIRFRNLGFQVWIDDFGSGYSSLDVLNNLTFDLIKFDRGFLDKLDEGDSGKIILTELMQMATSLGVDTVCEGVETEDQAKFLQEIGCSKLQGFLFSKPVPLESILEKYEQGKAIGYENPEESEYYAAIGKVNLYDLTSIVSEEDILHSFFDTLPMSVIELKDEQASYVRSNASYREFMKRYFHMDIAGREFDFSKAPAAPGLQFLKVIRQLTVSDNRTFFDEKMADGSTVHSFVRRISHNPVTGKTAIAIAILSITKPDEGTSYADIARALAADYYNIYVVDLDTERFIEYSSAAGRDELAEERHGTDFFEAVRRDTMTRVYEEDREFFHAWFSKENIISELDKQGVFTTTYRLIDTGTPMYAHMKVTRLDPGGNRIILGISLIDSQMKHKEAFDKEQQFQ